MIEGAGTFGRVFDLHLFRHWYFITLAHEHYGVSNYRQFYCLIKRLFRLRTKIFNTGPLCECLSPVTDGLPTPNGQYCRKHEVIISIFAIHNCPLKWNWLLKWNIRLISLWYFYNVLSTHGFLYRHILIAFNWSDIFPSSIQGVFAYSSCTSSTCDKSVCGLLDSARNAHVTKPISLIIAQGVYGDHVGRWFHPISHTPSSQSGNVAQHLPNIAAAKQYVITGFSACIFFEISNKRYARSRDMGPLLLTKTD